MTRAALACEHIRKEYPGTVALDNVSVHFEAGKINALIGKNGAGKSTLVKILAGAVRQTSGRILVNGKPVQIDSPRDAFDKGIVTVYQEMSLVPHLSVAENILLGRLPKKPNSGGLFIDWKEVYRRADELLDMMQVNLNVRLAVSELGVAQQQIVEIAKAMSFQPSALILDEPTSALAHHETRLLFDLIRALAQKGVAIIYITHRLQELEQITDRVTVLRDGHHIGSVPIQGTTPGSIVHMMFGETIPRERPADLEAESTPVLRVRNLSRSRAFSDINLTLYRGEILGIAGMLGSGRTELLKALFGADPFDSGEMQIGDVICRQSDPIKMKKLHLAFTPENRKEEGLIQILSTRINICLAGYHHIAPFGITSKKREREIARQRVKQLDISVPDTDMPVSSLSGGNQQKVVIGNWLNTRPRILLFDEPTRGIDVQAKQQIFNIMWDLSREGISQIFVSSELEELVQVCHRILIMKKGRIVEQVDPAGLSADELFVRCMEE